ncbi:uncharacterized protein CXQ87_004218 [Candidozyma duobushaemuli]|uniref:Uncharacterized protein n=2 Tax=Candidozyma TaxID=3303203 RepID=A0ABX8I6U6_9ASCO|nr:uncharacterized protein CXQ87_004218 [[Candida] duobushaemulonis]PVH16343.1 hypothetical protein CXQ87_004218 [[Candida] duobushaemulonis]QWU88996.1 hypothetical protein CA3LBN_003319 [[Candida] haemuloni]
MKRKPSLRKLWYANVYDASNDGYVRDVELNMDSLLRSKHHMSSFTKNKQRKVLLDPQAPDYEDVFIEKGNPMGPDDILEAIKPSALRIPVPQREEIPVLPSSDLLKALHYYSSHSGLQEHSCDETALLSLGMLVEQWADELVTDDYAKMFAEESQDLKGKLLPNDKEKIKQPRQYVSESEESDVISLDMNFSDVDSDFEIEVPEAPDRENVQKSQETEDHSSSPSDSDSESESESSSSSNSDSEEETQSQVSHGQQAADYSDASEDSELSSSDSLNDFISNDEGSRQAGSSSEEPDSESENSDSDSESSETDPVEDSSV